jgi:ubiquinone/menaquinone biosynthesis C-methylase UbiE
MWREERMSFYNRYILPHVIELTMRQKNFAPFRERTAGGAHGRVLEIGIGSGLNLSSFRPDIESVCGVDPSAELLAKAIGRVATVGFPVRLLEASSEKLPLEDRSFDTAVMTFTLCSIPDARAALLESRRVLKPTGALLFAEHGRAPDPEVMRWQDRLTPVWKRIGGGCHLNRKVDELIQAAGFRLERLSSGYQKFAPRPFSFFYEGSARPV